MQTPVDKPFKLNIMGLIILEGQNWTAKELLFIIGVIMLFVLLIVVVLNVYAIPVYGIGITIKKIVKRLSPTSSSSPYPSLP